MAKKQDKLKLEEQEKQSIEFEELIDVEEIESVLGEDKGEESGDVHRHGRRLWVRS